MTHFAPPVAVIAAGRRRARDQNSIPRILPAVLTIFAVFIVFSLQAFAGPGVISRASEDYEGLMFESEIPGKYLAAPLIATDVRVDVSGTIARVHIRQYYENPTKHWLEGIYVFPIRDKSAVDTLELRIGERVLTGVIKEREEAKRVYEKAKREGRKAALLESERPNIFTASVANIGPGETIVIDIEYQDRVLYSAGEFRLRFPMVVGPRFIPGGSILLASANAGDLSTSAIIRQPRVADAARITPAVQDPEGGLINPVHLFINMERAGEIAEITSSHHKIVASQTPEGAINIRLAGGAVPAERDFELTWRMANQGTAVHAFKEQVGAEHFASIVMLPPTDSRAIDNQMAKEMIFIIDTSGSMAGQSIIQAKAALRQALGGLASGDSFNIIRFSNHADQLFNTPRPADIASLDLARAYIDGMQANGGTNMRPALMFALDGSVKADVLRQVVFITDGAVGNEKELFQLVRDRLGDRRLFTVGIGSAPNSFFMRGTAEMGRGSYTFIGSPDQVQSRMAELWRKILSPAITDIEAHAIGGENVEIWPNPIPDLFAGEPVVLSLASENELTGIELTGKINGNVWHQRVDLGSAPEGRGIAKLWAREKIASLEASRFSGTNPMAIKQSVIQVALAYGLVTSYTSLVAVDDIISRPDGERLLTSPTPTNLPSGWEYDKVFGAGVTPRFQRWREASRQAANSYYAEADVGLKSQPAPQTNASAVDGDATRELRLPNTATPAALYRWLGFLLLVIASLLALRPRLVSSFK